MEFEVQRMACEGLVERKLRCAEYIVVCQECEGYLRGYDGDRI